MPHRWIKQNEHKPSTHLPRVVAPLLAVLRVVASDLNGIDLDLYRRPYEEGSRG